MSAHIVDDAHIDVLIDCALQFERMSGRPMRWFNGEQTHTGDLTSTPSLTALGQLLLTENARSVSACYVEGQQPIALTYRYRPTRRTFSPSEAIKAITCYEHQACEHSAWATSESRAFCVALRETILRVVVPLQESDPWTWSEEDLNRPAPVVPAEERV